MDGKIIVVAAVVVLGTLLFGGAASGQGVEDASTQEITSPSQELTSPPQDVSPRTKPPEQSDSQVGSNEDLTSPP